MRDIDVLQIDRMNIFHTCGEVEYTSKQSVCRAIRRYRRKMRSIYFKRKHKDTKSYLLRPYICSECGYYHVGVVYFRLVTVDGVVEVETCRRKQHV